ncbi:diacylglycerol/lipid kinase family protein [Haloarchaeobius amylolyticus]|uniref:diacylglycerol/lipid kinase family protein n=1 Tax=Haloarchaeobius amylolyticus TaxID=1198296 RepID=UPI00226ED19B|nr:diacylglycerol kinase family protein [Haloarchaeobius amylolyticus]
MQVGSRRCILNPVSGSGDHAQYVTRLLRARGFDVVETEVAGDARRLAEAAGEEAVSELAVCGGDGTVNEVLRGLDDAGHLESVTLSVVPAGTANILARNVGIESIQQGVAVADTGEKRTVDLGMAGDEPFAVSCIAGLPADASVAASSDLKKRFGTLAFLVTGVQEAMTFDGLDIRVDATADHGEQSWDGEAACLLVGNARRFVGEGGQGDMEDGLFDVAVVEQMPTRSLVAEAIGHRLLGQDTPGVTHISASEVTVAGHTAPITFSRDGEFSEHEQLTLSARPRSLELRVGPGYEPSPDWT